MILFILLWAAIFTIMGMIIGTQNGNTLVDISILIWTFKDLPLTLVLIETFAIGVLFTLIVAIIDEIRIKNRLWKSHREIKELKKELAEINSAVRELSDKVIQVSDKLSASMDKVATELNETNLTIRDSLKLTSETIKEMSKAFSKALEDAMKNMQEMKIQMDIRDTVLKSLGIDDIIPDFLKKKK